MVDADKWRNGAIVSKVSTVSTEKFNYIREQKKKKKSGMTVGLR